MARCEVCGNDYDKPMQIMLGGTTHIFDSFECAMHALAPACQNCGCRVVGHGTEGPDSIFCSAHCAHQAGVSAACDHVV